MDNVQRNFGLWLELPQSVYQAAVRHGNLRQAEALRRNARQKWEGSVAELADNHVQQSKFERGVALGLGLLDPKRVNTDHDLPRLNLPDGTGVWPRACPKYHPHAYCNGQLEDYGILIGGRVHESEGRCRVEIRAWIPMDVVRGDFAPVDIAGRGRPFYQIFWHFRQVEPIRTLVDRYHLNTSRCLPGPPRDISEMIDFAPLEPWEKCTDGCPDRRPTIVGGLVCNICGYYYFR